MSYTFEADIASRACTNIILSKEAGVWSLEGRGPFSPTNYEPFRAAAQAEDAGYIRT